MKRVVLTFGLISGALLSLMMVVNMTLSDEIGLDHSLVLGYTTMVLAFLLVFFGIRAYRDQECGGTISFGKACAVGALIALISTVCYVASWEVLYFFFMPDFADKYAEHVLAQARASGAPADEIARQAKEMADFQQSYRNPLINIAWTFLEPLPVALVMTLVSAGILRRPERHGAEVRVGQTSPAI